MLKAARESTKARSIAVMQPHRYTRLAALFDQFCTCFNDADAVIIAHVYAAGEAPIPGADRDTLVAGLRARGHRRVATLDEPGAVGPHGARHRAAGRLRGAARRGQHHAVGLCAAGGVERALIGVATLDAVSHAANALKSGLIILPIIILTVVFSRPAR